MWFPMILTMTGALVVPPAAATQREAAGDTIKAALARGDHAGALAALRPLIAQCEAADAGGSRCLAMILLASDLATMAGDLTGGERFARRGLVIAEQHSGPDTPETAAALTQLGISLHRLARFADAEAAFRRALDIRSRVLAPGDRRIAIAAMNLALTLGERGELIEAEGLLNRARAQLSRSPGDDPASGTILTALGLNLSMQGRYAEAEAPLREALDIRARTLPATHPLVAAAYVNLGQCLIGLKRGRDAVTYFRRGLAGLEASLAPDHPDVIGGYLNLGSALGLERDDAGAEAAYREVLNRAARSLPPNHPYIANTKLALGIQYREQRRLAEAQTMLASALAIFEAIYPADHPKIASALLLLAMNDEELNRPEAARRAYRRAYAILAPTPPWSRGRIAGFLTIAAHYRRTSDAPAVARTLSAAAAQGVLARLPTIGADSAAAQADLRAFRPVFVEQVRAAWTLSSTAR